MSSKYRDKYIFDGNREKALQRDGYKCVDCGMSNEEHLKKYPMGLSVHHIDGKGKNSLVKNNRLSNLQTLCCSCHCKKDRKRNSSKKVLKWNKNKIVKENAKDNNLSYNMMTEYKRKLNLICKVDDAWKKRVKYIKKPNGKFAGSKIINLTNKHTG